MREKKVLPQTIEKYIDFLDTVRAKAYGPDFISLGTIEDIVENCHINKSVIKPMEVLGLIRRTDKHQWEWLAGDPDKDMVLKLLDMVLHQRKKAVTTPLLPDFATRVEPIIEMLRDITKNQKELIAAQKNTPLLSRALNQSPMDNNHLFSAVDKKESQRFELIKAISSGVFNNFESLNDYEPLGHRVITVADHILELLNK